MTDHQEEVILLTGGSGFLGQHIAKELQLAYGIKIKEIRIVDLKPYHNNLLGYQETFLTKSFVRDISDKQSLEDIFDGVTCVIHCAALVSYEYPADWKCLRKNNVEATSNIVSLCLENNVEKLIFTCTAEVSHVPYIGSTCISVIINQTENRALPERRKLTSYAASKLDAENIVLDANGSQTRNGSILKTVSLRLPLIYGESDDGKLMTSIFRISSWLGGIMPRIAGTGGKHQMIYAGNAAWSHVCALKTLQKESMGISTVNRNIAGLPVFITDDTTIADVTRIFERLTTSPNDGRSMVKQSWWTVPILISLLLGLVIQILSKAMKIGLPIPPRDLVAYLGSFIFFSRMRASICMDYSPVYDESSCYSISSVYYRKLYKQIENEESLNRDRITKMISFEKKSDRGF